MKVLKFGGTSVGNAKVIQQVLAIVQQQAKQEKVVVVVSAMSGTTDILLNAGDLAAKGNEDYKSFIQQIEQRHLEAVKVLMPVQNQSSILSLIKKHCNEIEDLCKGIFLLQELSGRTKDKLVSYGELMSSLLSFQVVGKPLALKAAAII